MRNLILFLVLLSSQGFAGVKVCGREAQLLWGIVDHKWIETDSISAGMGSNYQYTTQTGDSFEAPFITDVYVVDHSSQQSEYCHELKYVNEDCVNHELTIGKYLGTFNPFNHCQAFVEEVVEACELEERKIARKWILKELYKIRGPKRTGVLRKKVRAQIEQLKYQYGL